MGASSVYTLSKKLASASPLGLEEESFYLALIVLLPLIGALVSFLPRFFSRSIVEEEPTHSRGSGTTGRAPSALSGWLASSFSFASFLMVCSLFFSRAFQEGQSVFSYLFWTWIKVGEFEVPLALRFDHLAGVMSLVVTGVGTLIHVYAIGYMKDDRDQPRFFAYLNLFLFAMLFLVLGDSLLTMFIGWEGVGVCSYLLIGFWFKDMVNAKAGQKAFVVNRIGDAGFIMGIFLLFSHAHTLQFVELPQAISTMPLWLLELSALCLFVGAIGKSAQIPLYVWLPDAMAGPTPVSALIHAATMVTAGVYMVSRMSTLFLFAPIVMTLISIVGVTTAFLAATIALVQVDIKKVLAYSTVSQLGFMFMALGAGAFSHGIFHVVTHAFFKACLFMSAGSVIMGCHHEQDMRKFGGLGKLMPVTTFCYLAASLAIAGFPFTSGFYSKDALLWTVFSNPILNETSVNGLSLAHAIWFIGAVTAFLTAFYMTRSFVMTFLGSYRGHHHPNESPLVVTVPIFILAILSLFFGLFSGEKLVHFLSDWTRSDMLISHVVLKENAQYHLLEIISILISLFGICAAFLLYTKGEALLSFARIRGEAGHRFLFNKWWVDELYDFLICRPLALGAKMCAFIVDPFLIDGMSKGLALFISASSDAVSQLQTGRLGVYCLFMVIATCALMGVIF